MLFPRRADVRHTAVCIEEHKAGEHKSAQEIETQDTGASHKTQEHPRREQAR